jgi:hypothetical protein
MKALFCVCSLQARRPEDCVRFGGFDDRGIDQIMATRFSVPGCFIAYKSVNQSIIVFCFLAWNIVLF